jgi:outer membrane protein assembly factor BamE (lipoprotein component of BamABCDE complex)
LFTGLLSVLTLAGCMTGGQHLDSLQSASDRSLTAGEVQRNIRIGMSGAEVAQVLGSPNIVTTDEQRREAWIYDRVATEKAYSTSEGGLFLIFGAVSGQTGATKTSQKTMTVIIKFDEQGKVRDYAYHSSRF